MRVVFLILALGLAQNHTKFYAEYCADDVSQNVISDLTDEEYESVNQLEQLQILFRHGARTVAGEHVCFGDWVPEWNCTVRTLFGIEDSQTSGNVPETIFQKIFHTDTPNYQDNVYAGDCMTGQLIEKGIEQQSQNGANLRSRFVGDGSDLKKTLFTQGDMPSLASSDVHLYSTNYQRTQASLYFLLQGFYNSDQLGVVPLHTRDKDADYYTLKKWNCKGFSDKYDEEDQKTRDQMTGTAEYKEFAKRWERKVGVPPDQGTTDCTLAHYCADPNLLPPSLRDTTDQTFIDATSYGLETNNKFNENGKDVIDPLAAMYLADQRAKWKEFLANGYPKFAAWSAHDSTVSAYLNGMDLFDNNFPVYATLLTIEIYSMVAGGYGVRVTRNGQPITQLMPECAGGTNICPIDTFFSKLSVPSWSGQMCDAKPDSNPTAAKTFSGIELTLLMIMSFALGVMFWQFCRGMICRKCRREKTDQHQLLDTEEEAQGGVSDHGRSTDRNQLVVFK